MTLTINREIYSQLLSTYQPRIIKTEEENEQFLEIYMILRIDNSYSAFG
jgi:HTH-type transcriptional regulator / antitoxin HigA